MSFNKLSLLLLASLFVLTSCKKGSDELVNVIPATTNTVVYFNTKSLAQKADYDFFQHDKIKGAIGLMRMSAPKELNQVIDDLEKDINSIGINLKGDIYLFVEADKVGVVLGMNNADKFQKNLLDASSNSLDIEELKSGVYYTNLGYFRITWDKHKILFLSGYSKEEAQKLFEQNSQQSIAASQSFEEFNQSKDDISIYTSGNSYSTLLAQAGIDLNSNQQELIDILSAVRSVSNISFDKGEITMNSKNIFENKDAEKKYLDLLKSIISPLNTNILQNMPENPLFGFAMNMDGKTLFTLLEKMDVFTPSKLNIDEQTFLDIKNIFQSSEGGLAISLNRIASLKENMDPEYEYDQLLPLISIFSAQKDGQKVLTYLRTKIEEKEVPVEIFDENAFSFTTRIKIYFGLKENILYCTNDDEVFNNIRSGKISDHKDLAISANDLSIFFADFSKINPTELKGITPFIPSEGIMLLNLLQIFDKSKAQYTSYTTSTGNITMVDQSKNSFAVICESLGNQLNLYFPF